MISKPQMNPASLYNRQLQWLTGSVIFVFFIAGSGRGAEQQSYIQAAITHMNESSYRLSYMMLCKFGIIIYFFSILYYVCTCIQNVHVKMDDILLQTKSTSGYK